MAVEKPGGGGKIHRRFSRRVRATSFLFPREVRLFITIHRSESVFRFSTSESHSTLASYLNVTYQLIPFDIDNHGTKDRSTDMTIIIYQISLIVIIKSYYIFAITTDLPFQNCMAYKQSTCSTTCCPLYLYVHMHLAFVSVCTVHTFELRFCAWNRVRVALQQRESKGHNEST